MVFGPPEGCVLDSFICVEVPLLLILLLLIFTPKLGRSSLLLSFISCTLSCFWFPLLVALIYSHLVLLVLSLILFII